jgi:hypothetical protein
MEQSTKVGNLTTNEWNRLQDFTERFESGWERIEPSVGVIRIADYLPPPTDDLRQAVLHELIKSDLHIRWQRGLNPSLEFYREQFPELGTAADLSPLLIYEEYRARHRYGDKPALETYQVRFPDQFARLLQLLKEEPIPNEYRATLTPAQSPPAPERELTAADYQALRVDAVYVPIKRIGKGSFGEIWHSEAPGGVEVAIKMIFGAVAPAEAKRELKALELIKRLRHVFLLPLHAYWSLTDRLLIAMELADCSLRHRLETCQKEGLQGIPLKELLRYFRESAEAIDYLHSKHVLHRDIKPENILLLEGHAKVADFGLARVLEESQRLVTASSCGTPAYTAPEVFWRGKVGAHSDQYSLAATYAELRLGRPLFPSRNWYTLMHDHLERAPELVPLLDPEQQVLRRALAKDPDKRFGSCRDFMLALLKAVPRE